MNVSTVEFSIWVRRVGAALDAHRNVRLVKKYWNIGNDKVEACPLEAARQVGKGWRVESCSMFGSGVEVSRPCLEEVGAVAVEGDGQVVGEGTLSRARASAPPGGDILPPVCPSQLLTEPLSPPIFCLKVSSFSNPGWFRIRLSGIFDFKQLEGAGRGGV